MGRPGKAKSKPGGDLGESAPDRRKGKPIGTEAGDDPMYTPESKETNEAGLQESQEAQKMKPQLSFEA